MWHFNLVTFNAFHSSQTFDIFKKIEMFLFFLMVIPQLAKCCQCAMDTARVTDSLCRQCMTSASGGDILLQNWMNMEPKSRSFKQEIALKIPNFLIWIQLSGKLSSAQKATFLPELNKVISYPEARYSVPNASNVAMTGGCKAASPLQIIT